MPDRRPEDPAFSHLRVDDCVVGHYDDGIPGSIQPISRPRATAIGRFASEADVDFREVRCTVGYMRFYTRQEVWDSSGRERWGDAHMEEAGAEDLVYIHPDTLRWTWCESGEDAEGYVERFFPAEPPSEWEPDEDDYAWEFCKPNAEGAVKVWVCEVRDGR